MSRILVHQNLPVRQFEQPDSVETAYVCKKSGLLAVDGVCTGDPRGSMAYTEYFAKGTTPTKSCDVHTAVKVCSSTGLLPTATCTTTTKIFVKRPAGSEGTTEDSAYAPAKMTQPAKGHNILDKITDILNPKKDAADMDADDSKKDGATTPGSDANSGSTTTPDGDSAAAGDSSGSGGTGSGTGSGSGSGGTTSGGDSGGTTSGGDSGGTTAPGGDEDPGDHSIKASALVFKAFVV